ncbi:MAG: competence protein ComEA [Tenuifilum sp.]|jgi:competence ComEA-like helix-hairpin-helix protein|nr:competence protein ComEA [Tenuifilum sp.]
MLRLLNFLKRLLDFTKSEQRGVLTLVIMLSVITYASSVLVKKRYSKPDPLLVEKADSFFASLKYMPKNKGKVDYESKNKATKRKLRKFKSFEFDPNTISLDSLVELGLSPRQAEVVVKYRLNGGQFKTPNDFSKLYIIDSATCARLIPLIKIKEKFGSSIPKEKPSTNTLKIELNVADTLSLVKLKGIGSSFAKRIVKYRNLLGGFYSVNQLLEVYGFTPKNLEQVRSNIYVDSTLVRKISINHATYEQLKAHPYITRYEAKSIVYYRTKKGAIRSLSELWVNKIVPKEKLEKLKHYLEL